MPASESFTSGGARSSAGHQPGIPQDSNQRNLIEHSRQAQDQAAMLEQIEDAVIAIDGESRVTYMNPAAMRLYARDIDSVIGVQLSEIYTYEWASTEEEASAYEALATDGFWRGENIHVLRDGTRVTVESTVSVERNDDGALRRMIATIRSVDERKRIEEELRISRDNLSVANAALARASRLKDEFLATVSHELRTPLTSMLVGIELVLNRLYGELSDRQRDKLTMAMDSGRDLSSLIDHILDVSKLNTGLLRITMEVVDPVALCTSCVATAVTAAAARGVGFHSGIPDGLPCMHADPVRVVQILNGLLSNAIKFTAPGGTVTFTVEHDLPARALRFTIRDNGIGITREDLSRLFLPFSQVDSGLSRPYGGAGLGLYLALKLVNLHNGSLEIESDIGAGSRFTVCLPLEGSVSHTADSRDAGRLPIRIIYAEDSVIERTSMTERLTALGATVYPAADGMEALRRAATEDVDVIVMDLHLPILNGLDCTRNIRALESETHRATPVIALSALVAAGHDERCVNAGCTLTLPRPIRFENLVAAIRQVTTVS